MRKLSVELTDELDSTVSRLAQKQGVSKQQIVRRALALLSYLGEQEEQGGNVVVRDEEAGETSITIHNIG